jgi:hypothetical protein
MEVCPERKGSRPSCAGLGASIRERRARAWPDTTGARPQARSVPRDCGAEGGLLDRLPLLTIGRRARRLLHRCPQAAFQIRVAVEAVRLHVPELLLSEFADRDFAALLRTVRVVVGVSHQVIRPPAQLANKHLGATAHIPLNVFGRLGTRAEVAEADLRRQPRLHRSGYMRSALRGLARRPCRRQRRNSKSPRAMDPRRRFSARPTAEPAAVIATRTGAPGMSASHARPSAPPRKNPPTDSAVGNASTHTRGTATPRPTCAGPSRTSTAQESSRPELSGSYSGVTSDRTSTA